MSGYVRQDVTDQIANGNTIDAIPLDSELDALQAAFALVGGHTHGGGIGEGPAITVIGPAQAIVASSNSLTPKTTNTVSLGTTLFKWKDAFFSGVANFVGLVADLVDINGGTIDGTSIGETTKSTVKATTVTADSFVGPLTGNVTGTVSGNASTASALATSRTISLSGDATGSIGFNGSANVTLPVVVVNDGHQHTLSTITDSGTMAAQNANSVAITGGSIAGITDLAIADGGTGASTAGNARTNLGLGSVATQNSNAVAITGGSVTGITDLAVADGGTGSSTAAGARTNLGAQASNARLDALAGLATTGIVSKTGTNTLTTRTLTGTSNQITVSNGDGVSGNPTISAVVASEAEAKAGTNTTKIMTPQRVKQALNASGTAPTYACRAWVNFNGTGAMSIRASGNVASITRNGAGDYTINFVTAMPNANYSLSGTCNARTNHPARSVGLIAGGAPTTTSVRITTGIPGGQTAVGSQEDCEYVFVQIFG